MRRVRQRRRRFTHHVDAYLIPAIGRLRRTAVTVRHLAAMFAELAAAATPTGRLKTPATPQRIRATLAGRLQRAIRDGVVADNPSRRVGMPVPRRPHAVVWTERAGCSKWRPRAPARGGGVDHPQLTQFLDSVADDPLFALWGLIALRGLRRGEAAGLRWQDVDSTVGSYRSSPSAPTRRMRALDLGKAPNGEEPNIVSPQPHEEARPDRQGEQ